MRLETRLGKKSVTVNIYDNGEVWVGGKFTNLKQWGSDHKRWSNGSGQEQSDLKGKSLEQVLQIRGYI